MSDDFDELASAYLDGQVTPAEAETISNEPEIMDRVESLRPLIERLDADVAPIDPGLRERHLAAALDTFDGVFAEVATTATPTTADPAAERANLATSESGAGGDSAASGVVDLGRQRAERQARRASTGRNGLPRWLGVAASLIVVVGGIGFLSQVQGANDSDDTAAETVDSDESAQVLTEATAVAAADSEGSDEAEASMAEMAEDADAEEAVDDEEADAAAAAPASTTTARAEDGLFGVEAEIDRARVQLDVVPTPEEAVGFVAEGLLFDPEFSVCGDVVEHPDPTLPLAGFVPVSIDGVDGELLMFGPPGSDELLALAVDLECSAIG